MTSLIAVFGDTHINSTVALCPERVELDDGGEYLPSPAQQWVRACWADFWQQVRARWKAIPKRKRGQRIGLHLGDIVESFHHGTCQLITHNDAIEQAMAVELLTPVREWCDHLIMLRGTEIHAGRSGYKEEMIARTLKADPCGDNASWWSWAGEIEGVAIVAAHHPGTRDGRNWTVGGAANRAAAAVVMDYAGESLPQLAIYGHNHVMTDSGINYPVRAMIAPAWSLKTAFVYRLGKAWSLSTIGGLIITCADGHYYLEPVTYQAERGPYWTP